MLQYWSRSLGLAFLLVSAFLFLGGAMLDLKDGRLVMVHKSAFLWNHSISFLVPETLSYESLLKSLPENPYRDRLSRDPRDKEALVELAKLHSRDGYHEDALGLLSRAIKTDSKYAEAFYQRGVAYRRMDDIPAALADFKRAVRLDTTHRFGWVAQFNIYLRQDRNTEVIALADRFIKVFPDDPEGYKAKSYGLNGLNRFEESLENLVIAFQLSDDNPDLYHARGIARREMGDYDAALADFAKVFELTSMPEHADFDARNTYSARCWTKVLMGNPEAALVDCVTYVRARRLGAIIANYRLGYVYWLLNDKREAMVRFEKAVAFDPDLSVAEDEVVALGVLEDIKAKVIADAEFSKRRPTMP